MNLYSTWNLLSPTTRSAEHDWKLLKLLDLEFADSIKRICRKLTQQVVEGNQVLWQELKRRISGPYTA
jgi:hypothetical protein